MAKKNNIKDLNMNLIVDTLSQRNYKCIIAGKYRGNAEYVFAQPRSWSTTSNNSLEQDAATLSYQNDVEFKFNGRPLLSLVFELRPNKKLKLSLEVGPSTPYPSKTIDIQQLNDLTIKRNNIMQSLGLGSLISNGLFNSTKGNATCRIFNLNPFFINLSDVNMPCNVQDFEDSIDKLLYFLSNINNNIDDIKNKSLFINSVKCKQGRNINHLDLQTFKQGNLTF